MLTLTRRQLSLTPLTLLMNRIPTTTFAVGAIDILWTFRAEGAEFRALAVRDGLLFANGEWTDGHQTTAGTCYAIDIETGEERWRFAGHGQARLHAISGDTVYAVDAVRNDQGNTRTVLYGLDSATGAERWQVALGGRTIVVPTDEDAVIVWAYGVGPDGGNIRALDAASGDEYWRRSFSGDPLPYGGRGHNGDVYAFLNQSTPELFALDAATGAERWRVHLPQPRHNVWVRDDLVVVASDSSVLALNRQDGEEVWRTTLADTIVWLDIAGPGISVASGNLLARPETTTDTVIAELDAFFGNVRWQRTVHAPASSLIATATTVCFAGISLVVAFDRATGNERWSFEVGEGETLQTMTPSNPIADPTLYVLSNSEEFALDIETGKERWRITLDQGFDLLSPSLDGHFFATAPGTLYAIEPPA